MAPQQHPATMEKLPGDLLSKIFIRLLAKQLAQMRCVSKYWNDLLSQSSFVKSHLDRSIHNNDRILLVFYDDMIVSSNPKPFTAHPFRSPHLELTTFIKPPVKPFFSRGRVIGSVNGLISFFSRSYYVSHVYIWNPSLSAMLTLPPYSIPSNDKGSISIFFRFGFNPKTDDYIVVKLACLFQRLTSADFSATSFQNVVKEWFEVEIYSMRKGCWEIITQRFPSRVIKLNDQNEVFVDGRDGYLHWLGYIDNMTKAQTIVAFDLGVKAFNEIPIPDSIIEYDISKRLNVLGVLSGKLCVMSMVRYGDCEVWVMNEYGVVESWVKQHVFSLFGGKIIPFGFTSHSEFVFDVYDYTEGFDKYLHLYDPVEANFKPFNICSKRLGATKIGEYVDSLVWVRPKTDCDISCCSISRLQILKKKNLNQDCECSKGPLLSFVITTSHYPVLQF